ncbi:MAG: hypothetical protein ACRYFX_05445 [Janthinobacterium lividum]
MLSIQWSKKYHEDLGEEDENGFFDYVYRYFVYIFYLPAGYKIKVRRYTDTIDECHLFMYKGYSEEQFDKNLLQKWEYISAVVNFMLATQEVKKADYFDGSYKAIDLGKLANNSNSFCFLEIHDESGIIE